MAAREHRKLIEEISKSAHRERGLWLPEGQRTSRTMPVCMTCGTEVEAVELKNCNAWSVELWARCHGQEDFYTVKFPFRMEGNPLEDERANANIKLAINSFMPFDPTKPEK